MSMPAPQTFGAHHISLTVTDLDRSTAFNTEVVRLTVRSRSPERVALHDGTMV
jgi:catechol 2,3-dioxygenase-like lactoylglutathione lyase family enzyme